MASRVRIFTLEEARQKIGGKFRKAGEKGAASPVTASTPAAKRAVLEQALGEMVAGGLLIAVHGGAKPKYFLREFAPNAGTAAAKIERFAAARHPVVLAQTELGKALAAMEKPFLVQALQALEAEVRLVRLVRGKAFVFGHAESLRATLGMSAPLPKSAAVDAENIRGAYRALVARSGFPDVEIAGLQRECGVPLPELKEWLRAEHRAGRADFYLGDWSLADDSARAGAIELRGEPHLLVRLKD